MSPAEALLVLAGGMLGAPVRYLLDQWLRSRWATRFPWGTWVANLSGSALLGFLAGGAVTGAVPGLVMAGLGFGFCGALTTYSTFGYETLRLIEAGYWGQAALNVITSLAAGLAAGFGAAAIAVAVWG